MSDSRAPRDESRLIGNEYAKFTSEVKKSAADYVTSKKGKINSFSQAGREAMPNGEDYWKIMDRHFYEILNESRQSFRIKTCINIAVVTIGVALVINSIVYTWLNGTNGWSLFSGGIGIGALVSVFFYRSQDAMTKAVANLSVVDMVFKSHYRAFEAITDYDYKADHELPRRDLADLKAMIEVLQATTKAHVELIHGLHATSEEENKVNK